MLTEAAMAVELDDDDGSDAIELGFTYSYFGEEYTELYIGSNGFVGFIDERMSSTSNSNLTSSSTPNGVIAGYWDDLAPNNGGTISYELLGEAPNREFVVAFDSVPHFGSGDETISFQIILSEAGGGEVICIDCQADDSSPSASQGFNSPDGNYYYALQDNDEFSSVNEAYSFSVEDFGTPDAYGDACDVCPNLNDPDQVDSDEDGVGELCGDNCPMVSNPEQEDADLDGIGDLCDDDIDGDEVLNGEDNCPEVNNADQADADMDDLGDLCDEDIDGDEFVNADDNCPEVSNPDQVDTDEDNIGDLCDDDLDGDGVTNAEDNCPNVDNSDQVDTDMDGTGDACQD